MPRLAPPIDTVPTLGDARDAWRVSMMAAHKSPKTISTYLFALDRLIEYAGVVPVARVTRRDLEGMQGALLGRMKASSVLVVHRALRVFWKWAVAYPDLPVTKDPMDGMTPPRVPEMAVEFLTTDELRLMLRTCRSTSRHNYLGHRDEAILRLLATTTARLSEVCGLRVNDIDLSAATARVMGKGSRERYLPLDDDTARALRLYLDRERPRHPAAASPLLWLSRGEQGMTPSGIAQMVAERGYRALGADHRRIHPHELRHRGIATLLGAGMSEGDVMSISGHRSRSLLDRYGSYTRAQRAHSAFRQASTKGALPRL